MSDWGATFSTVAGMNNGLDMDMYGGTFTANTITTAIQSGSVPASELNGMVQRILTTMFQFGLFDNPPHRQLSSMVTNSAHDQFALNAAAEGMVLAAKQWRLAAAELVGAFHCGDWFGGQRRRPSRPAPVPPV